MEDLDILTAKWVKMWNTYDLDEIRNLFHPEITYFSSERISLLKGIPEIIELHKMFGFVEGGKQSENKLWLDEENFSLTPEGAGIVSGIWIFEKGTGEVQKGPMSFVCTKQNGDFSIIHMNVGNFKQL